MMEDYGECPHKDSLRQYYKKRGLKLKTGRGANRYAIFEYPSGYGRSKRVAIGLTLKQAEARLKKGQNICWLPRGYPYSGPLLYWQGKWNR